MQLGYRYSNCDLILIDTFSIFFVMYVYEDPGNPRSQAQPNKFPNFLDGAWERG